MGTVGKNGTPSNRSGMSQDCRAQTSRPHAVDDRATKHMQLPT